MRLARRRGRWRRVLTGSAVVVVLLAGGVAAYALVLRTDAPSGDAAAPGGASSTEARRTSTTRKPTTTTTVPPVKQPKDVNMPPPGGLRIGSQGGLVFMYETRMKDLHLDPGPVDGIFDQRTQYAVIAVQKYFDQPRTGVIDTAVQLVLSRFRWQPAKPDAEGDRVEIDLDKQVITVFDEWQPVLLSTTSTGSGEYFCGGADGCQYAITPAGRFQFYEFYRGWKENELGRLWNPVFFNGGIAVHGLQSVPAYPASHGCARIPMHVADYFHTLVSLGEAVYVVGTPKQAGDRYVGPIRRRSSVTPPTTAPPPPPPSTPPPAPVTTAGGTTGTTKPKSTTTPPPTAPPTTPPTTP